jgi:hypothetical protein
MDATAQPSAMPPARRAAGDGIRRAEQSFRIASSHARRCRAAGPPPGDAEVARMIADFLAHGGAVTVCPPAHLLPVRNGAGRDAARWTA